MTSVYHLDGTDLRLTHFCAAQNQPRLKAKRIDLDHGLIDFDFVDITNLRGPDAPHVHGLEIRFIDSDHITVTFLFQGGGKESREQVSLQRVDKRRPDKGRDDNHQKPDSAGFAQMNSKSRRQERDAIATSTEPVDLSRNT
jgi:hypothetical protein